MSSNMNYHDNIIIIILLHLPPPADDIAPRTLSERYKLRTGIWGAFIVLIVVGGGRGALTSMSSWTWLPARSVLSRSAGCPIAPCTVHQTMRPWSPLIIGVHCSYHKYFAVVITNRLWLFEISVEVTIEDSWHDRRLCEWQTTIHRIKQLIWNYIW